MTAASPDSDVPPFRLVLPRGWVERPADRDSIRAIIDRTSAVFRAQHRPDLDAQMRTILEQALRRMQSARVFALYLQEPGADEAPLPISITAARLSGQLGGTLDRQVRALFRENGAEFLTDDQSIVRWQSDTTTDGELAGAAARVVNYLIPIPGTGRREAVSFTTTIPMPLARDAEDEQFVEQLTLLSDTLISTFAWEPAA